MNKGAFHLRKFTNLTPLEIEYKISATYYHPFNSLIFSTYRWKSFIWKHTINYKHIIYCDKLFFSVDIQCIVCCDIG